MILRKIKSTIRANRLNKKILGEVDRAFVLNPSRCVGGPLQLPKPLGRNLPERVIEILYAKMLYRPGTRVLDVGCANAMESHLQMIAGLGQPRHIVGIDISVPSSRTLKYYDGFIESSIVTSGIPAGSYDLIWCISALEHFGMDNSSYTKDFELSVSMDIQAVQEMVRLLAVGGCLLITIPFGRFEDHGWLKNYDEEHLKKLLVPVENQTRIEKAFFRHTHGAGWGEVSCGELQHVGYYDQSNGGSGGLAVVTVTKQQP